MTGKDSGYKDVPKLKEPEELQTVILENTETVDIQGPDNYKEAEKLQLIINSIKNTIDTNSTQRIIYAKNAFKLTGWWLTVVIAIVLMSGFCSNFKISDAVIITLITTTSANVLAFFVLVLKYLFNPKEIAEFSNMFNNTKNNNYPSEKKD